MLKIQEDFVHMAVHELKTPVTVLKAYTQMMDLNWPGNRTGTWLMIS